MRQRWSVSLLVIAAALGGYAAAGHALTAQADPFPFAVGDRVRFTKPDNGTHDCEIEEVRGKFVRCARPLDPRLRGGDYWLNVPALLGVEVQGKQ